ncbi:MAG: outer membrane protein assembly factor BamD [Gemmatimonadaceae bacterium]
MRFFGFTFAVSARPAMTALLALSLISAVGACRRSPGFDAARFTSTDELYAASLQQFEQKRWANAVRGFEKLTTDLPPRDPRLPLAHHYLARAQGRLGDHLIAAQTFSRLSSNFPDDTLADDALLLGAREYQSLWKRPGLDAEYGQSALTLYQTLTAVYPASPLVPEAQAGVARLEQMFATKDYDTGYHYTKRGAYDSAIIYFKDVIRKYPNAPKAREAYLRLLESYREINYRDEAREICETMRQAYPTDGEVSRACPATG